MTMNTYALRQDPGSVGASRAGFGALAKTVFVRDPMDALRCE